MTTYNNALRLVHYGTQSPVSVMLTSQLPTVEDFLEPEKLKATLLKVRHQKDMTLTPENATPDVLMARVVLAELDSMEQGEKESRNLFRSVVGLVRTGIIAASRIAIMLGRFSVLIGRLVYGAASMLTRFIVRPILRGLAFVAQRVLFANPWVAGIIVAAGAGYWAYKKYIADDEQESMDGQRVPSVDYITTDQTSADYYDPTMPSDSATRYNVSRTTEPLHITEDEMNSKPPKSVSDFEQRMIEGMNRANITDPKERAAFMAQVGWESGRGRYMYELWGPTKQQLTYEGRVRGLGNTEPGDGYKFRGRGFIQLTGRYNYTAAAKFLGIDLVNNPDLAARSDVAADIAIWYWLNHAGGRIPKYARAGNIDQVTRYINGGDTHKKERRALYLQYLKRPDIVQFTKITMPEGHQIDPNAQSIKKTAQDSQQQTKIAQNNTSAHSGQSSADLEPVKIGNQITQGRS